MYLVLTFLLIIFPAFISTKSIRNSFCSFSPNLSRLTIFFTIIPISFGIFGTYTEELKYFLGIESILSDETRDLVTLQALASIYLLLLFIYLFRFKFNDVDNMLNFQYYNFCPPKLFYKIQILFCILYFIIDLFRLPQIPIIVFINSGFQMASEVRGQIILYQIENGIPVLNHIFTYYPTILLLWILLKKNFINKLWLFSFIIIFFLYYLSFMGKAFFITPLLMYIYLIWTRNWSPVSFKYFIYLLLLLILPFYFVSDSLDSLISTFTTRLFVGQVEGMFMIREFFPYQDFGALLYGFPFSKFFEIVNFDPSVEIVNILFGNIDGWVNMNSFFVGQGYVMLGHSIILIGPLFVALNLYMMYRATMIFNRFIPYGYSLIIFSYFVISLPLNTNFSLIFYFKPFFSVIIINLLIFFIIMINKFIKTSLVFTIRWH